MKGFKFQKQIVYVCKCGEPVTRNKIVSEPSCFNCKQVRRLKASKLANLKRKLITCNK